VQAARIENISSAYRVLGRPERNIKLGRPRYRRNYNIKLDLQEVGWGSIEWIVLAQDREQWRTLLNAVLYTWVT
jgi:hypothetical protein